MRRGPMARKRACTWDPVTRTPRQRACGAHACPWVSPDRSRGSRQNATTRRSCRGPTTATTCARMARSAAAPRVRFQFGSRASLLLVSTLVAACTGGASRLPSRGLQQPESSAAPLARDDGEKQGPRARAAAEVAPVVVPAPVPAAGPPAAAATGSITKRHPAARISLTSAERSPSSSTAAFGTASPCP